MQLQLLFKDLLCYMLHDFIGTTPAMPQDDVYRLFYIIRTRRNKRARWFNNTVLALELDVDPFFYLPWL